MSNTSEFGSKESFKWNPLPIFKINRRNRKRANIKIFRTNDFNDTRVKKFNKNLNITITSVYCNEEHSVDTTKYETNPDPLDYNKIPIEEESNYFIRALSTREIHFQYLSMMGQNMSHIYKTEFKKKAEELLKMSNKFNRDASIPYGKIPNKF